MSKQVDITIRVSHEAKARYRREADERGYPTLSSFVREVVIAKLEGRDPKPPKVSERRTAVLSEKHQRRSTKADAFYGNSFNPHEDGFIID